MGYTIVGVIGTSMNKEVESTSFEACLEVLGHVERRRLLLALLNDSSEGDRTVALDRLDSGTLDNSLGLSMHHVHLPKLEGTGFVDTDPQRGSVTAGPRFDEIRPLLELLDSNRSQLPDGLV